MKKLLSVFLALALLLGAGFADGRSAASAETPDAALPAVGDTVEGFTVKELRDFPLVGATAVLFEHDRHRPVLDPGINGAPEAGLYFLRRR